MPFARSSQQHRSSKRHVRSISESATSSPPSPGSSRDSSDKDGKDSDADHSDDGSYTDESDLEEGGERDGLLDKAGEVFNSNTDALPVEEEDHIEGARALQQQASPDPDDPKDGSKTKPEAVSWSSLPRKDQLIILTISRLSEPLTQTSLQAYMFYQLKSFDPSLPDSAISQQAGLLAAGFTGAQFLTAMMWGRLADSERMGRKKVLLIGLVGTCIGAVGFGFSHSFYAAFFWRMVGGALNGNIGVMRTMISEIIREKKYQSRAFLLLPMTFNVGVIIGPILGGLLADPVHSFPRVFGNDSTFGGATGVNWMKTWPYALPNLVSAVFLAGAALTVTLGLEETLEGLRGKRDIGLRIGDWIKHHICRRRQHTDYRSLAHSPQAATDIELQASPTPTASKKRHRLPFRRIFTWNVIAVLVAHGLLASHVGTFSNLWFVFLSTPRYTPPSASIAFAVNNNSTTIAQPGLNTTDPNSSLHLPSNYTPHGLHFTGGLALPPPKIGTSLAILGVTGLTLQFTLFPYLTTRLGTVKNYRFSLLFFPACYALAPFLALAPTPSLPPLPADGLLFWMALVGVLFLQVLARTFALPATTILVNNASPHPSVLGTVHGVGQSVSSLMRTLGPVLAGWGYGVGLRGGIVGAVWWVMAGWALVGAVAGWGVREGSGHEIFLEGEEEEKDGEDNKTGRR